MNQNQTIYYHSPNVTNGKCPHCRKMFDAREAKLAFPGNIKGKSISFVYALCPQCNEFFTHTDTNQQIEIIKTSYINFIKNPHSDWTISTSLAMNSHSDNFFNAWWYGVSVPRYLFEAMNDGLIDEIACFPPAWRH